MSDLNSRQLIRGLWKAAEDRPSASRGVVVALRRHFTERGIVERMAAFEDFVAQTSRTPFVWGKSDCSLMVADWCVWAGRDDPGAEWRGAYVDEASCRALIAKRGDLAAVMAGCAASAELKPIAEPEFGCVAVIGSPDRPERQWAAIWNGFRWAVWWGDESRVRWVAMVAKPIAMWRV